MGLTVTGGPGGVHACLEDLAQLSRLIDEAADTVQVAAHTAAFGRAEIGGCGGLDLGSSNPALDGVLAGLAAPASAASHAAADLRMLATLLAIAAREYGDTDSSLARLLGSSLGGLPFAFLEGDLRFLETGNPLAAAEQVLTGDPAVVDLVTRLAGTEVLSVAASTAVPDGHPVVTDANLDVSAPAVNAPRSIADLVAELSLRNEGVSGEISVSFVYGADGTRRAIVDIPGTKSWTPGRTSDITSLATNLRAVDGASTSYETGVLEAMHDAGVGPDDPVMLVGHSEGGMVAVTAARDALAGGQFHVTHVVTAGAPIGRSVGTLPPSVSVLALEGAHDLVPHLDGTPNPDIATVTTVTGGGDSGSVAGNHGLDSDYAGLAREADASSDGSIRAFLSGAQGFLDQPYMTTQRYVISRGY